MGRMERVNEQVKREVGQIIHQELADPRLQFVTITKAIVSPDLHNAKIFFSVIGDVTKEKAAQQGLDGARGIIRRALSQRIEIRYTPELNFYFDKSIELSARIDETLQGIHDADKRNTESD